MKNAGTFLTELQSGALNGRMIEIYGCDPDKAQGYADRFAKVIKGFQVTFPKNAQAQIGLYSAPGRTEIGGNHTDHQYGCVLAASVNLDAIAAAALNGTNVIRFYSEGYGMIEADLSVLEPVESEKESTLALTPGKLSRSGSFLRHPVLRCYSFFPFLLKSPTSWSHCSPQNLLKNAPMSTM